MYKVIVADADKGYSKNFISYIQTSQPEFRVVGTAESALEVLALIKKTNADLVISDMQLTDATGYQLFKSLGLEFPKVKMILYLAFNEIDYGKKALEDGLISYILKPVKPNLIDKALTTAKQVLDDIVQQDKKHAVLLSQYEQHMPVFVDRFLINLVHGHIENESEILRNIKHFNMKLNPYYTVAIIKIIRYDVLSLALDENEKQLLIFSIMYSVKSYLEKINNGIVFINHYNSITVILGGIKELEKILEILTEIKANILASDNINVTISIGKTYEKSSDISISYRQAKSAMRYEFLMGVGSIIPITYVEPDNHITYRFPLKKEELLVYSMAIGDYKTCISLLNSIFTSLKNCGELPDKLLPKIILDILVSVNRYASEKNSDINDVFSKIFSVSVISEKNDLDSAYEYLNTSIKTICDHINENRKTYDERLFEAGKKYADTYYFLPISLNKTALYAETTPEYLNELFLKETGDSFYDYSIKTRIEKAKFFLLETNLNDTEIAKKVGYDDARHFSRIFFKYEKENLDSYRDKNKNPTS